MHAAGMGVDGVLFGAATAVASLIPAVGTLLVWVPLGIYLFVTHHVRSGRYKELWDKYVGGEAPELRIPGVMY